MTDPRILLQTAYFALLNGNLSYNSVNVPVYDRVPDNAVYPHVLIGQFTSVDDSDKSSFGENLTVSIHVVDRFKNSAASRKSIFDISGQVKQIIRARPVPINIAGYHVGTSYVDNENTNEEITDTYLYLYNNIRFRHLINHT